jgi:hypothetical protein
MKTELPTPLVERAALLLLLSTLNLPPSTLLAQGTAVTYQGRLNDGVNPANGVYDLRFTIYDSTNLPGVVVAGPLTDSAVGVSNGLFTVTLDFGLGVFTGADRWLEIGVRSNALGAFLTLSPRQQFTSTPYAVRTANFSGAVADNQLSANVARLNANQVFTGQVQLGNVSNSFTGSFTGDGSGLTNISGTFRWQVIAGTTQQAQPNTGYLATNASEVTITLPAAPNIGDTVRVSGPGSGGWKLAQNAGQSILGVNLGLIGVNWMPRDTNRFWQTVASSADGTKLVAGVSPGQIYTSTDSGVSWTARDSNRNWQAVVSSADGTKLVAAVFGGQIYTSIDSGLNWTAHDTNRNWQAVASSADGTKLVAGLFNGQLYTSTNSGVNWTARESSRNWRSVASSADGTKLIAAAGTFQLYTSIDSGVTWTARETNRNWLGVASSTDGSKLVATVNPGQIYTSTDSGLSWTPRDSSRNWISVASSADGSKLVAAVSVDGQIYTSADSGVNWAATGSGRAWLSVASSADGSKLAAVVSGGQIYTSTANSTAGTAGYLTGGQSTALELQYIGNGQFHPLSHEGAIVGN